MSAGYVYILTNPSMPGLVKVGKTTRHPKQRANELWQTGVPTPFEVAYKVRSPDCDELEAWVHETLEEKRVSEGREFFRCSVADAVRAVAADHFEQIDQWTSEYLPRKILVDDGAFAAVKKAEDVADHLGISFEAVAHVIGEMTIDEMIPASERLQERYNASQAANNPILFYEECHGAN